MNLIFNSLIITCILITAPKYLSGAWMDRKAEGWAWYEEKEKQQDETIVPKEMKSVDHVSTPSQKMAKIRENLENKLSQAVLEPTHENVALYISEQNKWVEQASQFSKVWSHVVLNNPHLDATVTDFPVSQYGIQVQKQIVQERKETLIKSLAEDYGLFYFYEGNNKTSQVFSLVVHELKKKYGWKVLGISMDGLFLPNIENNRHDNGTGKVFGVTFTPSLYLVNPSLKKVIPISFGLASLDQIENNIELQFSNLEEIK